MSQLSTWINLRSRKIASCGLLGGIMLLSAAPVIGSVIVKDLSEQQLLSMGSQARLTTQNPVAPMIMAMVLNYLRDAYQYPYRDCLIAQTLSQCDMRTLAVDTVKLSLNFLMSFVVDVQVQPAQMTVNVKRNPYTGQALKFTVIPELVTTKGQHRVKAWHYIGEPWNIDYTFKVVEPLFKRAT